MGLYRFRRRPAAAMNSRPDPCFDSAAKPLAVHLAQRRIAELTPSPCATEELRLGDALNRILAADLVSPVSIPRHAVAAMDGYAIAAADLPAAGARAFTVSGRALAGGGAAAAISKGAAMRIMTGAAIPEGADTVVALEHVTEAAGSTVAITAGHGKGQNVRAAGEDLGAGAVAIAAGARLLAPQLGVAAATGAGRLTVYKRPRIAILSTGDELREAGGDGAGGGEVFDSNRALLGAMLRRLGAAVVDCGIQPDDATRIRGAIAAAAAGADAVVVSGGASGGDADLVVEAVAALGEVALWRIALRPGRPFAFGTVDAKPVFALPGNPVAVVTTFFTLVMPAVCKLMGEENPRAPMAVNARLSMALRKKAGRMEVFRARLKTVDGMPQVAPAARQGSGMLSSVHEADCFIVLGADAPAPAAGDWVTAVPFYGLL
ncbi:MAG: molybdopterin molybdotransferase MoeA [Gammaproteobacteria bacterium]|nr:molybdopterin molybdotransferase MoeA [Gammaproteobacteria bacterium]